MCKQTSALVPYISSNFNIFDIWEVSIDLRIKPVYLMFLWLSPYNNVRVDENQIINLPFLLLWRIENTIASLKYWYK